MRSKSPTHQSFPLKIVGSSIYGRYPKISAEKTYNMFISDNWLVPYSGYIKKIDGASSFKEAGATNSTPIRAIYRSNQLDALIIVVSNYVYGIRTDWTVYLVGELSGVDPLGVSTIYIAENNSKKIIFCDSINPNVWCYDYSLPSPSITKYPTGIPGNYDFIPAYLAFQDGYFIAPGLGSAKWYLALDNQLNSWADTEGEFQTIPDNVRACVPLPGRGGQLFVMARSATESWVDVGSSLFPYQKNSGYSLDYGCISVDTIAHSENIVVWLGGNKDSGPVIMYSIGGEAIQISTDGINYQLYSLKYPEQSTGFLFKQDGHLFYQLTFYNEEDNLSLVYDFLTKKFFNITDNNGNYHIAKNVAMFNNQYCFVSINDPNIYILGSQYTTYDDQEIPRVRICSSLRFSDSAAFIVNNLTFTIEQGESDDEARIDLSVSRDGGVTYGNNSGINLNPLGKRRNKLFFWNLGHANDFIPRLQMWSKGRFVLTDGMVSIFQ